MDKADAMDFLERHAMKSFPSKSTEDNEKIVQFYCLNEENWTVTVQFKQTGSVSCFILSNKKAAEILSALNLD